MNWGGFPVGFRFASREAGTLFKKECWDTVLAACAYADRHDMTFHETEITDPYARMKVYIPIVSSDDVGVAQKNAEMWRRDTALLGSLTFYRPFVQENYLELFTPGTRLIGSVLPNGKINKVSDADYLPDALPTDSYTAKKLHGVFLSRMEGRENDDPSYATAMRKLAVHGPKFEIKRLNYTEGENALYYASAYRNALLCGYSYKTDTGEKKEITYALLPGGCCLADARQFLHDEMKRSVFMEFLRSVSEWHGNGVQAIVDGAAELPENCTAVTDMKTFYGLNKDLTGVDALFCAAKDAPYFKEFISGTLIEL